MLPLGDGCPWVPSSWRRMLQLDDFSALLDWLPLSDCCFGIARDARQPELWLLRPSLRLLSPRGRTSPEDSVLSSFVSGEGAVAERLLSLKCVLSSLWLGELTSGNPQILMPGSAPLDVCTGARSPCGIAAG